MTAPTRWVQTGFAVARCRGVVDNTFNARSDAATQLVALAPQWPQHAQHVRSVNVLYRHISENGQHIIAEALPPRFRRSPVPQTGFDRVNALLGRLCECLYGVTLARVYPIGKQASLLQRSLTRIAQ